MERYRTSDPSFVDQFVRSVYVDDITSGADTEEALELAMKSRQRLAEAGFNLRRLVTNLPGLQNSLSSLEKQQSEREIGCNTVTSDEESYAKNTLGDRVNIYESVKILGVRWKPTDDQIVSDLSALLDSIADIMPTKRNIIGLSARVYDPLGLLSPITVCFKIMFQDICAARIGWDETLSEELLIKWRELVANLKQSQPLRIPKYYFSGIDVSTLHTCTLFDVSKKAYAAVIFLQMKTPNQCMTRFMVSRTRVANSIQTIPRLELLAALLLARLVSTITKAVQPELIFDRMVCFTDSKIALYWIRGFSKEWKQFVQNRVDEIRTLVAMDSCSMWLNGPKWIADDEFEPQYSDTSIPEECLSEMKVKDLMAHSVLITQGCCQYEPVITCEHFSTLSHLLRVTAYFQKFISILKAKVKRTNIPSSVVTALDIESALLYWVKLSQKTLNQDEQFDAWQKQLGLYCDTDGVWRCKGRLGNADLQENTKYPIFLNRKHHLTALVVQDCHTRVMHNGVKETLTEFRSRYWIVRGSSTCEEDPEFGSGDIKADLTSHMRHVNHVLECFWRRWRSEYLAGLREYHAYGARVKPAKSKVAAGDVVLIYDADQPRTMWRMGRVESLLQSSDGNVLHSVAISMLCASRHSFTTQYLQINKLMEQFLSEADANEIHTYERELGYVLDKNLQMMCIETHVLFFQVILIGERVRKRMVDQGLMDYVICLPSVLPVGSRAQQRAKDLVAMLGKEMHL
eukprot:Em0001g1922a